MTGTVSLILIGFVGLIFGGDLLVRGASKIAVILGISPAIIGLTVVAFGTSTPELAVSLKAALAGSADIAISNVVGSNIFNILLILGLSALISPLKIHALIIRREVPLMIFFSALLFFMSWGFNISRLEGLLLFSTLVAYTLWLIFELRNKKKENAKFLKDSEVEFGSSKFKKTSLFKAIIFFAFGLLLVIYSADFLVKGAVTLAQSLGVSESVIGLTIVAAGTSLPELVASIIAAKKGESDIAVGNVVGSCIYNILAIVGLSGAIVPGGLHVDSKILYFDMPIMLCATLFCWPFFKSGGRLSRKEGALFLASYIAYTSFLIVQATR